MTSGGRPSQEKEELVVGEGGRGEGGGVGGGGGTLRDPNVLWMSQMSSTIVFETRNCGSKKGRMFKRVREWLLSFAPHKRGSRFQMISARVEKCLECSIEG